jgi:glutathione S-transferase
MDFSISQVRPAVGRLLGLRQAGAQPDDAGVAQETARLVQALGVVDAAVRERDFLLGDFTLADCAFAGLTQLPRLGLALDGLPAVAAYGQRLAARPAWQRVRARLPAS